MKPTTPMSTEVINIKKKCSKCGEEKELGEFHKDKREIYGVTGACRKCGNKYRANWKKSEKGAKYEREFRHEYRKSDKYKEYRRKIRKESGVSWAKALLKKEGYSDELLSRYPQIIEVKNLTLKIKRL